MKTALASLFLSAVAFTAWSCACSTAPHTSTTSMGSGSASSTTDDSMGLGSGTASGSEEGSDSSTPLPARGDQCGDGDACADGLQCVHYYGIAGPRGPELTSCETPCKDDPTVCTDGTKCVKIADGPGDVCR